MAQPNDFPLGVAPPSDGFALVEPPGLSKEERESELIADQLELFTEASCLLHRNIGAECDENAVILKAMKVMGIKLTKFDDVMRFITTENEHWTTLNASVKQAMASLSISDINHYHLFVQWGEVLSRGDYKWSYETIVYTVDFHWMEMQKTIVDKYQSLQTLIRTLHTVIKKLLVSFAEK